MAKVDDIEARLMEATGLTRPELWAIREMYRSRPISELWEHLRQIAQANGVNMILVSHLPGSEGQVN